MRIIVIRHAERERIVPGENSKNILLTEQGIQDALDFGKMIRYNDDILHIFSSPMKRAIQTATQIGNVDPILLESLGIYIPNDNTTFFTMEKTFTMEMLHEMWRNNQLNAEVIKDYKYYQMLILNTILINSRSGINIFVTHDWHIMALQDLFGLSIEVPDYLSGIEII